MLQWNLVEDVFACDPIAGLYVLALILGPLIGRVLFRCVRWHEPVSPRTIAWTRQLVRTYAAAMVVVVGSEVLQVQSVDTVALAAAGRNAAGVGAVAMVAFLSLMVASDHKWRANALREAKSWWLRAFIGLPFLAVAALAWVAWSPADPAAIRQLEALFLAGGAILPAVLGREFVAAATQLRPWLSRFG